MNVPPLLSRFLLLLNGLSLDAPLAAVAWQDLAARHFAVELRWSERLLLFLGTWLVYSADRLLDTLPVSRASAGTERHRFVRRNRTGLMLAWGCLAAVTIALIRQTVSWADLQVGIALVISLGIYFLLCLRWPRFRYSIPRELVVSLYFVAAVDFFPAIHSNREWLRSLPDAFTIVCFLLAFLNCLGISCWEVEQDRQAGEWTIATQRPGVVENYRYLALFASGVLAGMVINGPLPRELEIGAMLTAILFAGLDLLPLPVELKPVLADLLLIAPWVLVSVVQGF